MQLRLRLIYGDNPGRGRRWRLAPQDVAGVVAQPNWNTVSTLGGGDDIGDQSRDDGYSAQTTPEGYASETPLFRERFLATESTFDTPNAKMMKGVIKQFSQGTPLILSFTNVPAGSYDVYVYGNVDAGPVEVDISIGNKTNYWSEPGFFEDAFGFYESNSTDPSYRPEGNYVVFTNVSPGE